LPTSKSVVKDVFNTHWAKASNTGHAKEKIKTATTFLAPLISALDTQLKPSILDAGCGDGVHLSVLAKTLPNANTFAFDVSNESLKKVEVLNLENNTLMLADILDIPIESNSMDAAFSYGVIAYTGDPQKAIEELVRVTKLGGLIGISFYPKPKGLLGKLFTGTRTFFQKLPKPLQNIATNILVPLLGLLPTQSGVSLKNASWSECKEVVLVNLAPPVLSFYTEEEVKNILEKLGCSILQLEKNKFGTIWGVKQ
jgi:SAM-dependent methyltransferase